MAEVTLKDVREFFSTETRPVTLTEMKALTKADADELKTLVAAARS
jgi:hypothetical protein